MSAEVAWVDSTLMAVEPTLVGNVSHLVVHITHIDFIYIIDITYIPPVYVAPIVPPVDVTPIVLSVVTPADGVIATSTLVEVC